MKYYVLAIVVAFVIGHFDGEILVWIRDKLAKWRKPKVVPALAAIALGVASLHAQAPRPPQPRLVVVPSQPKIYLNTDAPGDSLPYTLSTQGNPQATFWKWTVTATRSLGPLPTNQVTTVAQVSFIVNKPGSTTVVDSVTFSATVIACNTTGCSVPSGATTWKYVRKVVPPQPGPIIVDSSQVIGLIAVPESVSYYAMAKRPRTMVATTCYTEPAHTGYPCQQDVNYIGCAYYRNGGNWSNTAPPMVRAKPVYWKDQFGKQYQLGGVAYNLNGTLHTQCASDNVLPILCIVAETTSGWYLLTRETWQNPECRKQLMRAPLHTVGGFWTFADTTKAVVTPIGKFEQAVADYANHPNAPWGWGNPGAIGYAALESTTPYPVGILQPPAIDVALGQKVELALYVRYSDGTVRKEVDPSTVYWATDPGPQSVTAVTRFGSATYRFNVRAPLRVAQGS